MNKQKVAQELVGIARDLTAVKTPKRHFTLDEKGKWTLFDQGMPVNTPRDLKTVMSLAERYRWEIKDVWLSKKGKFVPLSDFVKNASTRKASNRLEGMVENNLKAIKKYEKDMESALKAGGARTVQDLIRNTHDKPELGPLKDATSDLFGMAQGWASIASLASQMAESYQEWADMADDKIAEIL